MSTTTKNAFDRDRLLADLDEGYSRAGWAGTSLRPAVTKVGAKEAAWRPPKLAHSIAENVLHCAYWKNRVRHRLLGDRKRTFPLAGKDWFAVKTGLDGDGWADLLAILDDEHAALCEAVRTVKFGPGRGAGVAAKMAPQVRGIAMHDMYHTGQIKLIRAKHGRSVRSRSGVGAGAGC